jgi:hypothetical protein
LAQTQPDLTKDLLGASHAIQPLMDYLNPSRAEVDDEEVIAAAKFIHWTMNHPESQALQVQQMIDVGHTLLGQADNRIGLDGIGGDLCCIIMDIRHPGPRQVRGNAKSAAGS